jgi:hypothetical protein
MRIKGNEELGVNRTNTNKVIEAGKKEEVERQKGRNGKRKRMTKNKGKKKDRGKQREKTDMARKRYEVGRGKEGKLLDERRSSKTLSVSRHFTIQQSPGNAVYFPDSTCTSSYSSRFHNPCLLQENSSLRKATGHRKAQNNFRVISCKQSRNYSKQVV